MRCDRSAFDQEWKSRTWALNEEHEQSMEVVIEERVATMAKDELGVAPRLHGGAGYGAARRRLLLHDQGRDEGGEE